MHFQATIIAFAAALAFAGAQDLTGIPTCALPCFVAALPDSKCGIADTVCQCTTGRDAITKSLLTCAPEKCSASDVASLAPAVSKLCANAGVTISNVPTAAPTSGGSAKATSAASSLLSGARSATASSSPTGSAAAQSTGAATVNVVSFGAVAVGVLGMFGL